MNFIKNLINGNFSLVKTFWIFYILPSFLFYFLGIYRDEFYPDLTKVEALFGGTKLHIINFTLIMLLPIIYKIIVTVAVWKSSAKYNGRRLWFYLVRFYIAIEVGAAVFPFIILLIYMRAS